MADQAAITVETIKQLLRLDEDTGRLLWLPREPRWFANESPQSAERRCKRWNSRYAETEAFTSVSHLGYKAGHILGIQFRAHRVVFALYHGRWPTLEIDHIDRDRTNNRPSNLREVTRKQNVRNSKVYGASPYRGVHWHSSRKCWIARCRDQEGNHRHLGVFRDEESAARAYDAAALAWHGEDAYPNFPS